MSRRWKGPTIEWSYAWEETIISFRGYGDLSYCIISGRTSGMSGANFSITKWVISDDIDDIQDSRYHMSCRTFFKPVRVFAGTWMALRARNASPWGRATWNPQSTCHERRPGPTLAPWCWRALCVPRSREHEKTPAAGSAKNTEVPNKHIYTYNNICFAFIFLKKNSYSAAGYTIPRPWVKHMPKCQNNTFIRIVIYVLFSSFWRKLSIPQQVYYYKFNSGLWNTPCGKRHTSRTEPVCVKW